jgi:hypothetical protein
MYTDDLTIEQAWECLCDSLLNDAYSKKFNDLMGFIPRGTVCDGGRVVCSGMSGYVMKVVTDLFSLPDMITIEEGHEGRSAPTEDQKVRLRSLYMPTSYLHTLPWHVQQMLAAGTTSESKKIKAHMWQSRGALARKRLGALSSLPQLQ